AFYLAARNMSENLLENLTFEQTLVRLEQIVREMEDGQTNLEEALAGYESGVQLLRRCYEQLRRAEQRILLVTGEDKDGNASLRPFDHAATVDAKPRAKKREEPEKLF